ncbi:hypothetical protein [Burkholderia gladioli]|uniref:hypothetical protein n=1 Tax=Burkholderia gladioli TaxID=28095 RepID=UPI000D005FC4|nr:hypothetical protein [Burkholderia gladioli]PRH37739.1 hypothetical protein C6V07_01500 [Burkholderia gladioli]
MRSLSHTERAVEYRDGRMLAQRDREEHLLEIGENLGTAQSEADLVSIVNQCMRGAPDEDEERLRYFIARFVGFLDTWSYDKLSTAIREATGVCKDEDN